MAICKSCGSKRVVFKREDTGFTKTVSGSKRGHQTVGICKNCGYTWITNYSNDVNSKLKNKKKLIINPIVTICLIIMIVMFVHGKINNLHKSNKTVDYVVTEDNLYLVTNPKEEYIISKLKGIEGIIEVAPATKENDPNNMLDDENGYTSAVFFSYNKLNQKEIYGDDLLAKGTDAGGCIEVFRNENDAILREKHLGVFGISGSHTRIGTVIVRTSHLLSYEEQDILENKICKSLLEE